MNLDELEKLVKQHCTPYWNLVYFPECTTFNFEGEMKTDAIASPENNFSRWFGFLLPKHLKLLVQKSDDAFGVFRTEGIHVYHYSIMGNLKRNIEKAICLEKMFKRENEPDVPEPDAYLAEFQRKYCPASCFFTTLGGKSMLLGRQEVLQAVIDYYKENPKNYFEFMKHIMIPAGVDKWEKESAHRIQIYDFLKKPKYVKHEW